MSSRGLHHVPARQTAWVSVRSVLLVSVREVIGCVPVIAVDRDRAEALDDLHPNEDPAKDGVLACEARRGGQRDEELGAVCIGSSVCHGEDTCACKLETGVLRR